MSTRQAYCLAVSGLFFLMAMVSGCTYGGWPLGYGGHMMDLWHGGGIMWILLLVVIIIAVLFLIQSSRSRGLDGTSETPLDVLKKRYARGEIKKEEFDKIRRDLLE